MAKYNKQVNSSIYEGNYVSRERWVSYRYQIAEIKTLLNKNMGSTVLEVGIGANVTKSILSAQGLAIASVDIDPDLKPDYVASVTNLPFKDNSFDIAVAFQVLEHIEFSDFHPALFELMRVSKHGVIISIPNAYPYVSLMIKLPFISAIDVLISAPVRLRKNAFDGEHYWEIGRRGYSLKKIFCEFSKLDKFKLKKNYRVKEHAYHHFFIFEK